MCACFHASDYSEVEEEKYQKEELSPEEKEEKSQQESKNEAAVIPQQALNPNNCLHSLTPIYAQNNMHVTPCTQ